MSAGMNIFRLDDLWSENKFNLLSCVAGRVAWQIFCVARLKVVICGRNGVFAFFYLQKQKCMCKIDKM